MYVLTAGMKESMQDMENFMVNLGEIIKFAGEESKGTLFENQLKNSFNLSKIQGAGKELAEIYELIKSRGFVPENVHNLLKDYWEGLQRDKKYTDLLEGVPSFIQGEISNLFVTNFIAYLVQDMLEVEEMDYALFNRQGVAKAREEIQHLNKLFLDAGEMMRYLLDGILPSPHYPELVFGINSDNPYDVEKVNDAFLKFSQSEDGSAEDLVFGKIINGARFIEPLKELVAITCSKKLEGISKEELVLASTMGRNIVDELHTAEFQNLLMTYVGLYLKGEDFSEGANERLDAFFTEVVGQD